MDLQGLFQSGLAVFIICFVLHFGTALILRHAFHVEISATLNAIIAFSWGGYAFYLFFKDWN